MSTAITLRNVSVHFPLYQGASRSLKKSILWRGSGGKMARDAANRVCVQALNDVSLDIRHGDRIGLIGPNGAGKTTLLRVLAGIYEPSLGEVRITGRVSPMFDIGLGIDQELSGHDNIYLRGLLLGLTPAQIRARAAEIAEFTELGSYLHMPVRTYSSGMMLRLTFGISTCIDPEILLMDEWMVAGDATFLSKAQARIARFVSQSSILVLASHSNELIREWCTKAVLLDRGAVIACGPVAEIQQRYLAMSSGGQPEDAGRPEAAVPA